MWWVLVARLADVGRRWDGLNQGTRDVVTGDRSLNGLATRLDS